VRVFLDTNVLVSAFASRGLCADLVRHVLAEHELIVGEVVLAELRRVLLERIRLPRTTIAEIEALLRDQVVVPRPPHPAAVEIRDPSDRWILASAIAGNAEVLVSGDNDLLDLRGRVPLSIASPRQFWEMVRRREG
jgi:uncharacterized protein